MKRTSPLHASYEPSGDYVAREIDGEFIIVPLCADPTDSDELFCLNETGKAIWGSLDGRKTIGEIVKELARTFNGRESVIKKDVIDFIDELKRRGLLREMTPAPK